MTFEKNVVFNGNSLAGKRPLAKGFWLVKNFQEGMNITIFLSNFFRGHRIFFTFM